MTGTNVFTNAQIHCIYYRLLYTIYLILLSSALYNCTDERGKKTGQMIFFLFVFAIYCDCSLFSSFYLFPIFLSSFFLFVYFLDLPFCSDEISAALCFQLSHFIFDLKMSSTQLNSRGLAPIFPFKS